MTTIVDECYFVITHRAKNQFLRDNPRPGRDTLDDVRRAITGMVSSGRVRREYAGHTGHTKEVAATSSRGDDFFITLVLGEHRDGSPRIAPDGHKRVVFVTGFGKDKGPTTHASEVKR